jgi:hypothetical protein
VEEGHKVTKTSWTFGVVWCRMNEWNRNGHQRKRCRQHGAIT